MVRPEKKMLAKKVRTPFLHPARAQRAEQKFHPCDQMSCRVATFAKSLGEEMSCRVATFARSLETYDMNICLNPDDIYVQVHPKQARLRARAKAELVCG